MKNSPDWDCGQRYVCSECGGHYYEGEPCECSSCEICGEIKPPEKMRDDYLCEKCAHMIDEGEIPSLKTRDKVRKFMKKFDKIIEEIRSVNDTDKKRDF